MHRTTNRRAVWFLAAGLLAGCGSSPGESQPRNDLAAMQTTTLHIKGQAFQVWLATQPREQELGLMQVTSEELAPITLPDGSTARRGMLFVFPDERILAFWMRNTITALDIAYINADRTIVKTHTMAPLETRLYSSVEPARFALEVPAGTLATLGIGEGDSVEIPESVFKAGS